MRLLARQRSVYGKACEVTLAFALKACIANQFAADIIPDRAFVNSAFDVELVPDNHPGINGVSMKMPGAGSAHLSGKRFKGFFLPCPTASCCD